MGSIIKISITKFKGLKVKMKCYFQKMATLPRDVHSQFKQHSNQMITATVQLPEFHITISDFKAL